MTRVSTFVAILCATGMSGVFQPGKASAQDAASALIDSPYPGEFVRAGPGFGCRITPPKQLSSNEAKTLSEHACLRIGAFAVGNKAAVLKTSLGQPNRVLQGRKGATSWVYFFGKTPDAAYLVASVWRDALVALQVTGHQPADAYGFNGIKLGDTTDQVVQHLGKPMATGTSSEANTEVWSYQPWPFSLEISDGRVTSMRVADPQFN